MFFASSTRTLATALLFLLPTSCLRAEKKPPEKENVEATEDRLAAIGAEGPVMGTIIVNGAQLKERIVAEGRPTFVNAWASWCGPCREEYPMLEKMRGSLDKRGISLTFVSVDSDESLGKAVSFAKENGSPSPILVAEQPLGPFKDAMYENWPGMLPASFLFDKAGNLVHFWGGPVEANDVEPVVKKFLAGEPIEKETKFGLIPGRDLHGE